MSSIFRFYFLLSFPFFFLFSYLPFFTSFPPAVCYFSLSLFFLFLFRSCLFSPPLFTYFHFSYSTSPFISSLCFHIDFFVITFTLFYFFFPLSFPCKVLVIWQGAASIYGREGELKWNFSASYSLPGAGYTHKKRRNRDKIPGVAGCKLYH